ncbi:NTP-binding protein [Mycobacterium sp. ENV421]|uniref:DNA primase family protein n=1 Tax=Mycobacterium sp. ENV421 TaxID=1213407 RepID=UPI000C9BFBB8|nr:phage/plasmid primase, P4 family [Mycobacterium sp. ENV421]PND54443.1 NTP-binding protein [Mycobacterium sp. ENV421]
MTADENNNVVPIGAADKAQRPKMPTAERPVYPSPDAPLDVARELYNKFRTPAGRTLVCHRGDWLRWTGQQWGDWDSAHLRSTIYKRLGDVDYKRPIRKGGEIVDHELTRWNPNRNKVANVLEALAAVAHLDATIDTPTWIGDHDIDSPADQMIACTNGLLSLSTRELYPHTPAFFNTVSVPFAYQADAPKPVAWLRFLASVWPEDDDSIDLLQEWIGYIVTGRTDQQKILLAIGPTRCGKGTITRVTANLIGRGNVTGPTLASLGTNFGLAPLMGKPLAVIADARLGGRDVHTIVERLLSISGEDMLTVDRKFRDPWSGKLPTRLMILSNEIPRFSDASGAVANRLMVLQMRNSFLGKEDRTLDARLAAELPGILNWALEGLDRLASKGRFTVPTSSGAATTMLMDLASPTSAFVRDCCTLGHNVSVERDRLYAAWKRWCDDNGHEPGSQATFGRNLAAVVPDLGATQPRVGDKRIRYYTHIGISPVPPVPESNNGTSKAQTPHSVPVPDPVPAEHPTLPGTGAGTGNATETPQVSASGTGGTGNSAFSVVLKDGKRRTLRSGSAARWFHDHIADLQTHGRTVVRSSEIYNAGQAKDFGVNNLRQAAANHPDITTIGRDGRIVIWDITSAQQTEDASA